MQAVLYQFVDFPESDGSTHKGDGKCNWVQNHRTGQSIRTSSGHLRKPSAINLLHNPGGLVSNRFGVAVILISLGWHNIENAVAESTKRNT